ALSSRPKHTRKRAARRRDRGLISTSLKSSEGLDPFEGKKTRRPKRPPRSRLFRSYLELKPHADLDLPRRIREVAVRVGHRSERRVVGKARRGRAASNRAVGVGDRPGGLNDIPGRLCAGHVNVVKQVETLTQNFD